MCLLTESQKVLVSHFGQTGPCLEKVVGKIFCDREEGHTIQREADIRTFGQVDRTTNNINKQQQQQQQK